MRALIAVICSLALAGCVAGASEAPVDQQPADKRFPVSRDYPPGTMERFTFKAGGAEGWTLSGLRTPERAEATWKIVIITGTPSWSEYWAPTIAALPASREMAVADRPGFAESEPREAVTSIAAQAEALSPLLEHRADQKLLLLGQSYGAAISVMMAKAHPDKVDALILASSYFGDRGPTARRMYAVGALFQWALPNDLKNSISEVRHQRAQLPDVFDALGALSQPVLFVHGSDDTFITPQAAEAMAEQYGRPLVLLPEGDHFLNACCVAGLLSSFEAAIATAETAAAP